MDIKVLQSNLRGDVLIPGSIDYESSRRIWNGMIDRRPAAIACCTGPADVRAAVRFAVDQDIYPAIRAGGHNVAGFSMVDDGLVLDLTRMKGIYVDPQQGTATAQTGLTWGQFDRETQLYGLATTGGLISTTGIAGLTLGGGIGWLMGRCGLTCDNTLSYDIVLANGNLVRANADECADLFWALKGGGGNFGVITSITYRMYPMSIESGSAPIFWTTATVSLRFAPFRATRTSFEKSPSPVELLSLARYPGLHPLRSPRSLSSSPPVVSIERQWPC
jgi:FAD/FMN-containing dehydrogenase